RNIARRFFFIPRSRKPRPRSREQHSMPAANSSGPSRRRSRPQARSIAVRSITKNICKSAVWPPATSEPVLVEDTISKLKGRAETLGLFIQKPDFLVKEKWRRGWDSNPRYGFPHARFRGECFQPLSHLSGVVGTVNEAWDAGLDDSAGAHAAGLDGDVERGVGEAVVAEKARGFAENDHFRVGSGVIAADGAIAGAGQNLAVVD